MRKVPEVSRRLGVSDPTTWRLIYSGALPHVKIGRAVRVRDEDIDAFIQSNLQQGQHQERGA